MRLDAHAKQVARPDIVGVLLALGDRQDRAVAVHRLLDRGDRALAADEQRRQHMREEHRVDQRHDRQLALAALSLDQAGLGAAGKVEQYRQIIGHASPVGCGSG